MDTQTSTQGSSSQTVGNMTARTATGDQQKFALVIGNSAYVNTTPLRNPVNDANDMAEALHNLGFTVTRVIDGNLDQMVDALIQLKNQLSASSSSYGFFYYAGHGVQSNGENFLIPVDANIPSENFLRNRALSVQEALDELNDAGNDFNVFVLDACRDNPFGWARSGSRGLSVVGHQPADSIIVFSTAAGSVAEDGIGRNGLFTTHLLNNLRTPGIEVNEMFRRTGADVSQASDNRQRPAVYSQFYRTAYYNQQVVPTSVAVTQETGRPIYLDSLLSEDIWRLELGPRSSGSISTTREFIDGKDQDVLTIEVNVGRDSWANISLRSTDVFQRLKESTGIRFKVLGDGRTWIFHIGTNEDTGYTDFDTNINTRNNRVVEMDISFARLSQLRRRAFNRDNIAALMIGRTEQQGRATIKIFDIEIY